MDIIAMAAAQIAIGIQNIQQRQVSFLLSMHFMQEFSKKKTRNERRIQVEKE